MPRALPFHGVRFDWKRIRLSRALCPPYDVILDKMARRLRKIDHNTIHLELPKGGVGRYRAAAKAWLRWRKEGTLIRDLIPAYYVIEQRFRLAGKEMRRAGFLSTLMLDRESLAQVTPHEKTLSKPKKDRKKLLEALQAQTSPIFALYEDGGGRVRRILARITRRPPAAEGLAPDGVFVRVWRGSDSEMLDAIERAMEPKMLLIADGHHRLEVSRKYGCRGILCYLCAEEDPGLRVLPTHRVLAKADGALARLDRLCALKAFRSAAALQRAVERHSSPLAFGVAARKRFLLAVPSASSVRGIRSGLGVEWLAKRLFSARDFEALSYTHSSREAFESAAKDGAAFLVKSVPVKAIRKAVSRIGLLPQKSTYFFPKVEAGIVFNEI